MAQSSGLCAQAGGMRHSYASILNVSSPANPPFFAGNSVTLRRSLVRRSSQTVAPFQLSVTRPRASNQTRTVPGAER